MPSCHPCCSIARLFTSLHVTLHLHCSKAGRWQTKLPTLLREGIVHQISYKSYRMRRSKLRKRAHAVHVQAPATVGQTVCIYQMYHSHSYLSSKTHTQSNILVYQMLIIWDQCYVPVKNLVSFLIWNVNISLGKNHHEQCLSILFYTQMMNWDLRTIFFNRYRRSWRIDPTHSCFLFVPKP